MHTKVFLKINCFIISLMTNEYISYFHFLAGKFCVQYVSILHPIVAILPAYFRFAQCIRRYRDTKEAFPHLVNAAKYATSFFVVIFAHKFHTTSGKWRNNYAGMERSGKVYSRTYLEALTSLIMRDVYVYDTLPIRVPFMANRKIHVNFILAQKHVARNSLSLLHLPFSISGSTDTYGQSKENPWFYCWITAALFSSCYAYIWDIKMDWGLFDAKAGENRFLREEIVYSSTVSWVWTAIVSSNGCNKYLSKRTARKTIFQRIHYFSSHANSLFLFFVFSLTQWFYYFGIIEDLILRFSWTLSMSLIQAGYIEGDVMITILSPLEVFRRFIWNYFRLENEHLNNVGKFRAVRDISVAPMDCSDQV